MRRQEQNNDTVGGITIFGVLTIIFITLKLCGLIHWRWIWVLSPIWIGWAAAIVFFAVVLGVELWKEKRG